MSEDNHPFKRLAELAVGDGGEWVLYKASADQVARRTRVWFSDMPGMMEFEDPDGTRGQMPYETGLYTPAFAPGTPRVTMEQIALIAEPGMKPALSPYGYVITEDGTSYALTERWFHGVAMAVLFPNLALENGWAPPAGPIDDLNVYHYQDFEHFVCRRMNVIRVAFGMMYSCNVSKGRAAATPQQLDALRAVFKVLGKKGTDTCETELRESTVAECLQQMAVSDDY